MRTIAIVRFFNVFYIIQESKHHISEQASKQVSIPTSKRVKQTESALVEECTRALYHRARANTQRPYIRMHDGLIWPCIEPIIAFNLFSYLFYKMEIHAGLFCYPWPRAHSVCTFFCFTLLKMCLLFFFLRSFSA